MRTIKFYTGLLLTMLFLASCGTEKKEETKEETPAVVVKTLLLKSETKQNTRTYFGTLKFAKATQFVAQQSGIITKLNAVPGQKVKRGEVIAIYPPANHNLQVSQAKILQNKNNADYKRAKELYDAGAVSKVDLENFKANADIQTKSVQELQRTHIITAPFSGVITQVHANIGKEVSMDMPIFSMAQMNNIEVDFYVIPKDITVIFVDAPVLFYA